MEKIDGWAILSIQTDVIWKLTCKFTLSNAKRMSPWRFEQDQSSSAEAFEKLFGHPEEREPQLAASLTTDPQAEVMIYDALPQSYIESVLVKNEMLAKHIREFSDVSVDVRPDLFRPRQDHLRWHNQWLDPNS